MIKVRISPNTKFSQNIARGTILSRAKNTEELNTRVFKRILQLYGNKNICGLGAIKSSYNSLLPERKNVQIVPLPVKDYDDYGGGVRIDEEKNNLLSGYTIEIPTNKKKKLNILELSSFMHESTHILDYLFNPKYIANYRQMCQRNIYDKKYFEIYDKYFYNPEEMKTNSKKRMLMIAEEQSRQALKNVAHEDKLVFLNFIRYSLEMERHAYAQDVMYAKLLQKLGKPTDKESLEDYTQYMAFTEKIEIVNKLIQEEILNTRTRVKR